MEAADDYFTQYDNNGDKLSPESQNLSFSQQNDTIQNQVQIPENILQILTQ